MPPRDGCAAQYDAVVNNEGAPDAWCDARGREEQPAEVTYDVGQVCREQRLEGNPCRRDPTCPPPDVAQVEQAYRPQIPVVVGLDRREARVTLGGRRRRHPPSVRLPWVGKWNRPLLHRASPKCNRGARASLGSLPQTRPTTMVAPPKVQLVLCRHDEDVRWAQVAVHNMIEKGKASIELIVYNNGNALPRPPVQSPINQHPKKRKCESQTSDVRPFAI